MTFMMEPDTGVLSLSNKRRQGMKLLYQLNVSVSDGVFTNTAQVRQLLGGYNLVLSADLLFFFFLSFAVFIHSKPSDFSLASLQIYYAHLQLSTVTAARHRWLAEQLCNRRLMCVHVISDLL